MLKLDTLVTAELVELSQRISHAIDMSHNEEIYTILDEIENILALRDNPDIITWKEDESGATIQMYNDGSESEMNQGWLE